MAIVGGILALLSTIVTNFLTAGLARQSAQQTLQADLIKRFVDGPPQIVRDNLQFLADTGLVPDYANSIKHWLVANPRLAPQVGSRFDISTSELLAGDEPARLAYEASLKVVGDASPSVKLALAREAKTMAAAIRSLSSTKLNSNESEAIATVQKMSATSILASYPTITITVAQKASDAAWAAAAGAHPSASETKP